MTLFFNVKSWESVFTQLFITVVGYKDY